ncbi:transporter substrate-binding domain-containing protein [Telmatospirillum sp.]|uniref:transporter substrate-binding domain-containing protein n=1 Tax=Telmatospirillum sp. TaxID=2079197 RepID=UPI0028519A8F|nr:transporter substrate-binding domain-containing protein [Telmatospirillum sp.]MDR3439070.1 transporter substrate-binding domain-containing protein [Telmatospirillum sp.]
MLIGRFPSDRKPALKRVVSLVIMMVTAMLAASPAEAGATLDRVHATGQVVDILITEYPPFGFINPQNQMDGFDVDVAKAFAAKLGAKLKIETPAWETIISGHWAGRWDVAIASATPTAERAKMVNFPARYYKMPAVLLVHQDEKTIKSAADLSGKRVGVGNGSTYEAYLNQHFSIPGDKPMDYPFHDVVTMPGDETINARDLALGPGVRLNAVVTSLATARSSINSTKRLKIVGEPLFTESNAVITDKGDPEWDAEVKRVFAELKADGTLTGISQKWFGEDITKDAE